MTSAAGFLAAAPFAFLFTNWFRPHGPARIDRVAARAREAALAFRADADMPSTDMADAFAAFVAECLECPVRTVIGPELSTRLSNAGVSRELASRAADEFDALIASRYGGRATAEQVLLLRELVDALALEVRDTGATHGA